MLVSSSTKLREVIPFKLLNVIDDKEFSFNKPKDITLIMFICNHCPFVKHILPKLTLFANKVDSIAISPNDENICPKDSPGNMKKVAKEYGFNFPYLYDQNQKIAFYFDVKCTPEFFIVKKDGNVYYHGRFDASLPGNSVAVTGDELINAFYNLKNNKPVEIMRPSMGCSIKF